jgi:hypothetical protein
VNTAKALCVAAAALAATCLHAQEPALHQRRVSTSSPEAFGQFLSQESAKLQNLVNQGAKIDLN